MAFWGNSDGAKLFGCTISRVTLHRMVSAKNMTSPEGALKRSKLKTISTVLDVLGSHVPNFVGFLEGT